MAAILTMTIFAGPSNMRVCSERLKCEEHRGMCSKHLKQLYYALYGKF